MITTSEAMAYLGDEEAPYPLEAVRPEPRRVLEVGAGAGSGTLAIAAAFPDARIVCLETDDAARNALVWRIAQVPGLRERVSVLPLTLEETEFLGTFDLALARHVLCRVAPADRGDVATLLSRRAGYDGAIIIDDHLGTSSTEPSERRMVAEARFGELTYARWQATEPAGQGQVTEVDEYVVTDRRGDVVHHARHEHVEWVADRELLLAIVRAKGMAPAVIGEGWIRLTTP